MDLLSGSPPNQVVQHDLGEWLVAGCMLDGPLTRAWSAMHDLEKVTSLSPFPEMVISTRMGHFED